MLWINGLGGVANYHLQLINYSFMFDLILYSLEPKVKYCSGFHLSVEHNVE